MKRDTIIIRFVTLFLATICSLPSMAYDFMVDGLCYNINSDGTSVTVTYNSLSSSPYIPSYSHLIGSLEIPSRVSKNGITYSVTIIGRKAFQSTSLTSIDIPNSVTKIDISAFENCLFLTSVAIPNSVTTIGERAFLNCTSLTSIEIPESVTDFPWQPARYSIEYGREVEHIESSPGIFNHCTNLTDVKIYGRIRNLGAEHFRGCSKLTTVELPSSLNVVGSFVFKGCNSLKRVTCHASQPPKYTGQTSWTKILYDGSSMSGVILQGNLSGDPEYNPYHTFYGLNMSNIELYVPAQSVQAYKEDELWKNFKVLPIESGIDDVNETVGLKIEGYYDVQGRRFDNPVTGINIVRYSDGTTKKTIVR